MPSGELKVGQLVFSRAGRDKGRPFLIWKLAGPRKVYLVDGDLRRVDKPKLKNVAHLQVVNRIATNIRERLYKGETIIDAEVRQAIAQLLGTDGA
ncbi:MAG: hypothetical protein PWP31_1152 [Clostridia bacterium]|nr:hypothetical protein [Clostridia bacterium]